jgi:Tat protein translocase TatB subunit
MFNMTGSEVMFLLIIGLVVLGPEKLPDAIRRMGKLYAELKRMSSGVQTDFRKVMDEPIKEMMNTTNSMKALFTDTASEFQSAAKELVEPTFIPYESGAESAQAQESEQSDSDQDDDADIAEGIANAARIAQQRKDDTSKHSEVNRLEYNEDDRNDDDALESASVPPESDKSKITKKSRNTTVAQKTVEKKVAKKAVSKKKQSKKKAVKKTQPKKSTQKSTQKSMKLSKRPTSGI